MKKIFTTALLTILITSCDNPRTAAAKRLEQKQIPLSSDQIILSVKSSDHGTLSDLLICGAYPDQPDSESYTPLQTAILKSDTRSATLLLENGASPDFSPTKNNSPLALAALKADIPTAHHILNKTKNISDLRMPNGERLLHWCIIHGRTIIARELIQNGADIHTLSTAGLAPLTHAIDSSNPELVTQLLEKGADPGKTIQHGSPILIRAIEKNLTHLIPLLCAKGADVNALNAQQKNIADILLEKKLHRLLPTIAKHGLQKINWEQKLWQAYQQQDDATFTSLLHIGASASSWDSQLRTPLDAALEDQRYQLANHLQFLNRKPGLALQHAASRRDHKAIDILLTSGVSPNHTQAPFTQTPLCAAIRSGDIHTVHTLIKNGADISTYGLENQAPLNVAIAAGHHHIVSLLLQHGANPNATLSTNSNSQFLSIVKTNGMKWYLRNDRNITPLMLAVDSGNLDTVRTLLQYGAKKSAWTAINKTWPLNFASRKNDIPMMRLMLNCDPHVEDRHIIIDLSEQRATLYNQKGEVTYSTRVSTGKRGHATPTGSFVITNKHREWYSTIYDAAPMPYFQRLSCSDFGLHQGICPGYPASHGCIRVPAGNIAKLYSLTQLGDRVTIQK